VVIADSIEASRFLGMRTPSPGSFLTDLSRKERWQPMTSNSFYMLRPHADKMHVHGLYPNAASANVTSPCGRGR
jgi:hypothetical protein